MRKDKIIFSSKNNGIISFGVKINVKKPKPKDEI